MNVFSQRLLRSRRSGSCSGRAGWLVFLLIAGVCGTVFASNAESRPLRLGMTSSLFNGRNENDILAALKVWAEVLTQERNVNMDSNIILFTSLDEAKAAVEAGSVDSLTLLISEYADISDGLLGGPFLRDETDGTVFDEFVVLSARTDSSWSWSDLRGKKIGVYDAPNVTIALNWLNAQLAGAGLGPVDQEAAVLNRNPKISSSVLSVFFGNSDACLVSRKGFEMMVELNPQVGEMVSVVASSPPILSSIFCFRSDLAEHEKADFAREITQLQETLTGQQVLCVFHADRMANVPENECQRSMDLFREWRQTMEKCP